jgi:alkylation response protein AidB-like acyl-CoA dehydrogenase
MDLKLTEIQELLLDSARSLFSTRVDADRLRAVEASDTGYDSGLWDTFTELGWQGLTAPESAGGSGGSVLDLGLLLEQFGRNAVASPFLQAVTASLVADRAGDTPAAAALVADIAGGGRAVLVDTSEPERHPVAQRDGDGLQLSSGRLLVEWAEAAGTLVVPALVDGGVVLAAVPRDARGLEVTPARTFDNERVAFVRLDRVEVRPEGLLTGAPLSVEAWQDERALAHLLRACDVLGASERALEMTVEYMKVRKQFGVVLGAFQAIRHMCANMRIELDGAQLITRSALWRATAGLPFATQAEMAAFFVRRTADHVLADCAELHGGIGFTLEYPLQFYYRRAKAQSLRLGPVTRQLASIADRVLPADGEPFRSGLMDWPVTERQEAVSA